MNQRDFEQAINEISRQIRYLGDTQDSIEYLDDQLAYYKNLLVENQGVVKRFNPAVSALRDIQSVAYEFLYDQTLKAIEDSVEFDYEPFRSNLLQAVQDPKVIEITLSGKNTIRIYFRMNEVAGNIRQWGQAVTSTRRQLRISKFKKTPMSPEMASQMWKEKYYMPAREGTDIEHPSGRQVDVEAYIEKYQITMALRAQNMQSLAPFWSIIDKGTRPLSSDWGGEEYPTIEPTNFLEETAKEIRRAFVDNYNANVRYLNEAKESIGKLEDLIKYINELVVSVGNAINRQIEDSVMYSPPKRTREEAFREFTRDTLAKRLQDRYSFVDQDRVDLLTELLMAGESLPQRFPIGVNPRTGRAIRTRTLGLQRAAGLYRQRSGQ